MSVYVYNDEVLCLVNGSWSSWGTFSSCDKSCGGGWTLRFRQCNNPAPAIGGLPCVGDSVEISGCNAVHCPVDGGWSTWSNYSHQCTGSCGQGVQVRTRTCSKPPPSYGGKPCLGNSTDGRLCKLTPCQVDGNWGQWGDFRHCDTTCGGGFHMRMRSCNDPPPSHGGLPCPGQSFQTETCNVQPCPNEIAVG
ncbi:coadhesin-like [Saccostrea cucullata]|uniref:coadhesin-like n=1 Tax=Saccostrea cuccullata TaxID=36930 RepID=UPI002ED0C599